MPKQILFTWVFVYSLSALGGFSPALELKLRPILRAIALEMTYTKPIVDLPDERLWTSETREEVSILRLRLAREIDNLPVLYNLDRLALKTMHDHLWLLSMKQPIGPEAEKLFQWALQYVERVGSGPFAREALAIQATQLLANQSLPESLYSTMAGHYKRVLTAVLGRPRPTGLFEQTRVLETDLRGPLRERLPGQIAQFRKLAQQPFDCAGLLH